MHTEQSFRNGSISNCKHEKHNSNLENVNSYQQETCYLRPNLRRRKNKLYSQQDLLHAIDARNNQYIPCLDAIGAGMTRADASRQYGIPQSTLFDNKNKKTHLQETDRHIITPHEEDKFSKADQWIITMSRGGN